MVATGMRQSIIISGESSSGKTETAKHVLRFLTTASAKSSARRQLHDDAATAARGLEHTAVATSHVLEALGNAKTLSNNNSSRFGKYVCGPLPATVCVCVCACVCLCVCVPVCACVC